ncbi:glucans biosynthesis glucosyltransferase MdoH [Sulfitobacter sp. D35]|uniref:glucans biosynthesis glucosyltransferase MdoH n=1 Tax=Sulfitobacter sp. D35 TaxID=3083252 RepID=UPI00296F4F39|nr:glucans biosynthesis glucosyltransferase MdoH [Sulfitobacter sp. D35]MDW4497936.1 glucans biosynthesis glucosyltransferase MdoH [Sulfitobacter sp. D35]
MQAHAPGWTASPVRSRRRLFLALNLVSFLVLNALMLGLLMRGGLIWGEVLMLASFALTVPWLCVGFWNSLLGLLIDRAYGPAAARYVASALALADDDAPLTSRVAIVMPVRDEDPQAWRARLQRLESAIARSPWASNFAFHVLSDTRDAAVAAAEAEVIARWRKAAPGARIHYRRRMENTGYKAGNIFDFLDSDGDAYNYFLPLDADSEMGAETLFRMVRVMQESPEIGMLQSLVTGMPSKTFFTRAFQFGMRHGMRSYTLGAAWWQADCGPNWGHNLIIRTEAFRRHCRLPVLPGRGPLAGHILSHDQVEAVLMRRAGFEVRVMAEESESREENPPSLVDFIGRELRWMNGNMQYLRLLGMPGLLPVSRMQLLLAIQMYIGAPAWMAFILLGTLVATTTDQMRSLPVWMGLGFFAILMTISLMPKIMGVAQVLTRRRSAEAYGGRGRVLRGFFAEAALMMLVAPVVAFSLTLFGLRLLLGRSPGWRPQQRSRARLEWSEAARALWPHTLAGIAMAAWLGLAAPWTLPFAAPIVLALAGAIPLATLTTAPALGRWSRARGLFDIPEDRAAPDDAPITTRPATVT